MGFIPPCPVLLQATADYLEQELLPTLDGYHRFQTRIAIKVLRTAMREGQSGSAQDASERQRLAALLGHEDETAALRGELAQAIATGRMALDAPGLVPHLRQTLAEGLAINSPRFIGGNAGPATAAPRPAEDSR